MSQQRINSPAPFDEFLEPPRRIDPNHPPFLPRLSVSPDLEPFIPYITGRLIIEVQNDVEGGPRHGNEARTVYYNLLSYNTYRNKDMEDAAAFAADFIEAIVFRENLFDRIPQVVDGEIPRVVDMLVGNLIQRYPDLEQFYDQGAMNNIIMAQRNFHDAVEMIREHRRRLNDMMERDRYQGNRGYGRDDRYQDTRYDPRGRGQDPRDQMRRDFPNRYPDQNRGGQYDQRGSYQSTGRGAQAYGERMRQHQQGGHGHDPRQHRDQGHRQSNQYNNQRQSQPPQGGNYGQQRRGRVINNPYAKMLDKREQQWEEAHAQERRPQSAYQQPQREQQRGQVSRPNLRRDAPTQFRPSAEHQEEMLSSKLPWEDGYEEQEQRITEQDRDRERRKQPAATPTQPQGAEMDPNNIVLVDNPTVYEQDPQLNEGSVCYTIEHNSPLVWKPSPKQWHKPSYRPADQIRLMKLFGDDTVTYEIFQKDQPLPTLTFFKGQETVDFLKHIAPHSVLKRTAFVNSDEYKARQKATLENGLVKESEERNRLIRENKAAGEANEEKPHSSADIENAMKSVVVEARHTVDTSDQGAITTVDLNKRRAQKNHEAPILAYRNYLLKIDTRVAEDSLNNPEFDDVEIFLDQLREAETYQHAAYALDKMRQDPGADPVFVQMANDRLIKAVNRQLRFNLSISKLTITDNFDVKTIEQLSALIKERFGPYVWDKFNAHQEEILQQIFVREEEPTLKKFDEMYDTEGLENQKLYHLASRQTVTLLNLRLTDIGREIDRDTGSSVEMAGMTWSILNSLMNKGQLVANEKNLKIYRHLIRLSDGTMLELHKGHLAQGSYILSYAEAF